MKRVIGILCILLGVALLAGAAGLLFHNEQEAAQAETAAQAVMPQMVEVIQQSQATTPGQLSQPIYAPIDPTMKEVQIDGYGYVGFVSVPDLGLELPVMGQWDEERMKLSPCRYTGSHKTDDLVILAHSYARFFRDLDQLEPGAEVIFTDMDGVINRYEVIAVDILSPYAVEEMISSEYDLTLFTCTYGGGSRITVRCNRT